MRRIAAVLLGVAALLLPVGATAHAQDPYPNLYGHLVNWDSNSAGHPCAGLYGDSLSDGAIFTAYTCGTAGFHDVWNLVPNWNGGSGTWYQLKNNYSGKCAMPVNYSTTVGADVVQVTCTPAVSSSSACSKACSVQLWRFDTPYNSGPGPWGAFSYLYNRYTNQCLNLKSGSVADGTHIAQTNCGSSHLSDIWAIENF